MSSLPAYSQSCPNGIPDSTNYNFRGDRCEGILRGEIDQTRSGSFRLVSLATGKINNYGSKLILKIPVNANSVNPPEVKIESIQKDYLIDNLILKNNSPPYIFQLPSDSLKKAEVPPDSLQAIAWTTLSDQTILYLPVILGLELSQDYEIAWYTRYRAKITRFDIIQESSNKIVKSCPLTTLSPNGEAICNWDGGNYPAGRYQIYVELEQYPSGKPTRSLSRRITFEHDPKWFSK